MRQKFFCTFCFAVPLDCEDSSEATTFLRNHLEALDGIEINAVSVMDQVEYDAKAKELENG